ARARRACGARPLLRGIRARSLRLVDPVRVTARRGSVVEAVHRVHAVAVEDGRLVDSAGDPRLVTFFRSSAKPIQALPLARERDDVPEDELAIACASHRAESAQ